MMHPAHYVPGENSAALRRSVLASSLAVSVWSTALDRERCTMTAVTNIAVHEQTAAAPQRDLLPLPLDDLEVRE